MPPTVAHFTDSATWPLSALLSVTSPGGLLALILVRPAPVHPLTRIQMTVGIAL